MSKFERGITNKAFIDALNKLRKDPMSYWSKMIQDKDLYIAIRKNKVNVYYQGNSLCELSYRNGKVIGKTNYKFLLNPSHSDKIIEFVDGKNMTSIPSNIILKSYDDLPLIKRAMSVYYGEEKNGVHEISTSVSNVLDVEIAFEKAPVPPKTRKSTDRIDFLRLEIKNNQLFLVFYEAKLFTNKEIRKPKGTQPPVVDQLNDYIAALKLHNPDVLSSYALVCKNLQDLGLLKNSDLANKVMNKTSLQIDPIPRLVIFGFDEDQRKGAIHNAHLANIKSFTACPVIAIGNPKSF